MIRFVLKVKALHMKILKRTVSPQNGGRKNETIYGSESCPLQSGLLDFVPGRTLKGLLEK